MTAKPILFNCFRSSSSWRVRIALALKGIEYEYRTVSTLKGEQLQDKYLAKAPLGRIPGLEIDGMFLTESLPIIEYLEETRDGPALIPKDPKGKFRVRQLSEIINSSIQPLQNSRILLYVGAEKKMEWGHKFVSEGLEALEKILGETAGKYSVGDNITMADLCLVPQVYSAGRFEVDMTAFPIISRINAALSEHKAFIVADYKNCPDCPEDLKK